MRAFAFKFTQEANTTLGPKLLVLVSAALLCVAIVAIYRLRGLAREREAPGVDDGEHLTLQGSVWIVIAWSLGRQAETLQAKEASPSQTIVA